VLYDRAPLQVTQFEADIRIARNWKKSGWKKAAAAIPASPTPCRGTSRRCTPRSTVSRSAARKGYLFTVGDEEPPPICRPRPSPALSATGRSAISDSHELLTMVSRMYHVFHVIVEEGSHARHDPHGVRSRWTDCSGQRVIGLSDHTKLAEVIVSAIEVNEGRDRDRVAKSWSSGNRPGGAAGRGRADNRPAPARWRGAVLIGRKREDAKEELAMPCLKKPPGS
jgi:hypothetical protein